MTTRTASAPVATGAPRPLAARIGWTWILLSAVAIAVYAVIPYLTASLPALADQSVGLAANYADRPLVVQAALYVHIVAGGTALVLGPLQFWRGPRERRPRVHRTIGRVALIAIAVAAVAGLTIAPFSQAGFVGFFGFGALAVLWALCAWRGYRAIRSRDVTSHQAWMIRTFALTYAAVTLRLWLPLLIVAQTFAPGPFDFDAAFANAYAAVPFLCWLPNLLVAEWLIRRRGLPSLRIAAA